MLLRWTQGTRVKPNACSEMWWIDAFKRLNSSSADWSSTGHLKAICQLLIYCGTLCLGRSKLNCFFQHLCLYPALLNLLMMLKLIPILHEILDIYCANPGGAGSSYCWNIISECTSLSEYCIFRPTGRISSDSWDWMTLKKWFTSEMFGNPSPNMDPREENCLKVCCR